MAALVEGNTRGILAPLTASAPELSPRNSRRNFILGFLGLNTINGLSAYSGYDSHRDADSIETNIPSLVNSTYPSPSQYHLAETLQEDLEADARRRRLTSTVSYATSGVLSIGEVIYFGARGLIRLRERQSRQIANQLTPAESPSAFESSATVWESRPQGPKS